MSNPYIKKRGEGASVFGELKRLFGSPIRLLATLIFVLLPLAVAIAGAVDFVTTFTYETGGRKDNRKTVWVANCLLNNPDTVKLCKDKAAKVIYYPPFLPNDPKFWYFAPFVVALFGFVSVGNPRARYFFTTLKEALGFSTRKKNVTGGAGADISTKTNWLIGAATDRKWQSDPGYFYQAKKQLPYSLNPDMLRTNLLIVAPPGSGKTSSVFRPLIAYLRSIGASAIFFDSKGKDFPAELFDKSV
jgi:hypothetical protein